MTKQFILIGHPVGHSVSPAIHHAAYEQLHLDAQYRVVDCPDRAAVEAQVRALRSEVISGANVTVPHKQLAFELADEIDPTAARVGVANVLARTPKGRIVAFNTDASALGEEITQAVRQANIDNAERPCALVLGNGGAAKAAVVACQLSGVKEVLVSARKFDADRARDQWPEAPAFVALGAKPLAWPVGTGEARNTSELGEYLQKTHLIVQATSAGMKGAPGGDELVAALPWERFPRGVVYDLVYNPPMTPFLKHAAALGHYAVGGLGMLVGQASDAIGIWLGVAPDRAPLLRAARESLGL